MPPASVSGDTGLISISLSGVNGSETVEASKKSKIFPGKFGGEGAKLSSILVVGSYVNIGNVVVSPPLTVMLQLVTPGQVGEHGPSAASAASKSINPIA